MHIINLVLLISNLHVELMAGNEKSMNRVTLTHGKGINLSLFPLPTIC